MDEDPFVLLELGVDGLPVHQSMVGEPAVRFGRDADVLGWEQVAGQDARVVVQLNLLAVYDRLATLDRPDPAPPRVLVEARRHLD